MIPFFRVCKPWLLPACLLFCYLCYGEASRRLSVEKKLLETRLLFLEKKRADGLKTQENLIAQREGHLDPRAREMILIQELGVVPEQHIKVYFFR